MKPLISDCEFGHITVEGSKIEHDIIISMSGDIKKRKKKLSKMVYGTSHKISLEEAKYIYQKGAERLIIGSGHQGMVHLSKEADEYLKKKKCKISIYQTPEAIKKWNNSSEKTIGLFHITC